MRFRYRLLWGLLVGTLVLVMLLGLSSTTQATIPSTSEVHTAFLFHKLVAVPNSSSVLPGVKSFVPTSNIVVVGVSLEAEIYPEQIEIDSGAVIVRVEASRGLGFDQDGSILGIRAILLGKKVIIANYNDVVVGKPSKQASILFPSGTGMSFSAGEPVYMNFYMANYWQRIVRGYSYAIVYYMVE